MTTIEVKFDKKVKCGPEYVALRIIDQADEIKMDNIWLPDTAGANGRLAHCVIEDVGDKATEEYGIKVGDYVMIDRLSTFAHTAPVCLIKYNNVICKTNKEKSEFFPLKNMIFVEPESKDTITNVDGVYLNNYEDKLNIGKILKMDVDADLKSPFAVGDRVLLAKGGDVISFASTELHIFKHDMLICKIVD